MEGERTLASQSKTDLMYEILYNPKFVPLPSRNVNIKTTVVDGKPSYLMKNHTTGIYYDIDELTDCIWNVTDGKRTVKQIIEEVQSQKPKVLERDIVGILLFFAESNLLVASIEPKQSKRFKVVSAFEIDFSLIERSSDFLQSVYSRMRPIFKRSLLWAAIAFIIVCTFLFAGTFVSIFGRKANFEILGSSVVGFLFYYFVALAPVIAIHEIAHGLALVHYGGKPGAIGTGLLYFGPMFYIETTDAWGLNRLNRIMVYLAGGITTLLIGSTLVVAQLIVKIPEPSSHIITMMAFYCFNMTLFNLAPPFETDGYYILSDIVNVPTLRQDSYSYLSSIFKRALGRQPKARIPGLTRRRKRIFLGYAVLSVTWIIYIVFQSSLFLVYMGQDVTTALAKILQTILSSQVLPVSTIVIAVASILYFGMQVLGYGFLFSVAVKKATARPLRVEAIHDRDLAIFAYLPPESPESLSNILRAKMEKVAKKFSLSFEVKQIGRSAVTVLRMGGTSLALVQIKQHLKQVESEFSLVYQKLVTSHKEALQKSTGIYAPHKAELTTLFERIADESVDAGNSTARSIVRHCEEKQNENLLYLLSSAFGTVWTIEVQPAQEYEIQKDLVPSLVLEDLTLTDLYGDTENFKKQIIYGFDSLARLATEIATGIRESLARPEEHQLVSIIEPIKSRIVLIGRTESIEKDIHLFVPLFVAHTWSGYLDNLLSEACLKLSSLNRARLPSAKEIRGMSIGELAVLSKDLSEFMENQKQVNKSVQESEKHLIEINESLQQLKNTFKPSKTFKIGLLESIFRVNVENLANMPTRIKEFRREWAAICERIEKIREHVEKEYDERKPSILRKKHKILRTYPLIAVFSIIFLILSFQPSLATLWIIFLSVALIPEMLYWVVFYHTWRSFRKVTRYPSEAFDMIHLLILALIEAVYGYVITGDVLAPV